MPDARSTSQVAAAMSAQLLRAKCKSLDVMYINPVFDIMPLGYAIETGMDDVIRFKFVAKTNDPSTLFDLAHDNSQ